MIDEVSYYEVALSADDVASLVAAGSAGKCGDQPWILTQPERQRVPAGGNVTLNVWTVGLVDSFSAYQWTFNGENLAGATDSTLTLTSVQLAG